MNDREELIDQRMRRYLSSHYGNTSPQVWKKLETKKSKKNEDIFVYKHLVVGTVYLSYREDKCTVLKCVPLENEKKPVNEPLSYSYKSAFFVDKSGETIKQITHPVEKKGELPTEYIVPKIVKLTLEYYKSYLTQVFKNTKPNEWKMVDKYSNQSKEKIIEFKHSILGKIAIVRKENSIVIDKANEKIKLIMNNQNYIYGLSSAPYERFNLNASTLIYITNKESWLENKNIDSIEKIDLKRIFGIHTHATKILNMISVPYIDIGFYTTEALEKYLDSIGISYHKEFSKYCEAIPVPPRKPEMPYYIKTKMF